eukprot:6477050-Amphidinium_carterae.1
MAEHVGIRTMRKLNVLTLAPSSKFCFALELPRRALTWISFGLSAFRDPLMSAFMRSWFTPSQCGHDMMHDSQSCGSEVAHRNGLQGRGRNVGLQSVSSLRNFQTYLDRINEMLTDEGMFLMQVAGMQQSPNWEDLTWGLFMSRYIFPGADASTPLYWSRKKMRLGIPPETLGLPRSFYLPYCGHKI